MSGKPLVMAWWGLRFEPITYPTTSGGSTCYATYGFSLRHRHAIPENFNILSSPFQKPTSFGDEIKLLSSENKGFDQKSIFGLIYHK